jgi:hypothetical protein
LEEIKQLENIASLAWNEAEKLKQKKKETMEKIQKNQEKGYKRRPTWGKRKSSWRPSDFDLV